ncbi:MAG: PKD domain-containing protein, partial [Patescibacteria group bacterium]
GGLSNSVEYLVLKDKTGALLDSINASAGWPAGDNSTKETMQKYEGAFVTATGTPKFAHVPSLAPVVANAKSESGSSSSSGSSGGASFFAQESALVPQKEEVAKPWRMNIGRDRIILPGTPIELSASFDKISGASYLFKWNFGDGTIGDGIKVTKIFEYPGTYAVVVNGSAGEVEGVDRISIEVVDPEIEIAKIVGGQEGFLEIKNGSKREVNIGRFRIASVDKSFTLPPDTILLPKTAVKFSNVILGIKDYGTASLFRPDGKVLTEKMFAVATSTREKLLADIEKKILDLSRQLASIISSFK